MRYTLGLPDRRGQRYWLVDSASMPSHEVLRCFYESTNAPVFRWLYEGTAYDGLKDVGPLLLDITQAEGFLRDHEREWLHKAASVIIDTSLAIDELHWHLSHFITVGLESGGTAILRFHEPMTLHLLLGEALLSQQARDAMAGAEAQWSWALCVGHAGPLYEHYEAPSRSTRIEDAPIQITTQCLDRLAGVSQLTRLMPTLAEALDRYALHSHPEAISRLWLDLEAYWRECRASAKPLKMAADELRVAQRDADSLGAFLEWMARCSLENSAREP